MESPIIFSSILNQMGEREVEKMRGEVDMGEQEGWAKVPLLTQLMWMIIQSVMIADHSILKFK